MHRSEFPRPLLTALLLAVVTVPAAADDWPQWLGPKRDGVWRETGLIDRFPDGGPKVLWRTPVGGGYTGPAVANGNVYLLDRQLAQGVRNPANPFARNDLKGTERVLCLDAATGKEKWKHEYDCTYNISYPVGPRCTPTVAGDKVYTLGAMGDLFCLNADTGKVIWSKNFPRDYEAQVPLWGFAAHPLIDGDRLICLVGGEGSVVVAFDKDTGKERWKMLSLERAELGYCPPVIYEFGGRRQLIIWHPEAANGLDPETGKVHWSQKWNINANMTIPTPRRSGAHLFLSNFYNGSMMLKMDKAAPKAEMVWRSKARGERPGQTDILHCVMATPIFKDGHIYGVCSYGELRCIEAENGKRVWMSLEATGSQKAPTERWANAFIVEQGDRYWLANEKGDLIIAKMSPKGYEEISRAHLLAPTSSAGRPVVWSHPAFANKCAFLRNDKEIICVSLAK